VATILIAEPHGEVRELFTHVVSRLGHEAVWPEELAENGERAPDVLLLEPADAEALRLAIRLRGERPGLPLIFASIYPPTAQTRALEPVAFLTKPFLLAELEAAVRRAVDAG
jgi:CheY-like chemotaxis protein